MSEDVHGQAWQRLDDVASTHRRELHPELKDWEKQRLRLHQAAVDYVATCKSSKPKSGKQPGGRVVGTNGQDLRGGLVMPFGRDQGVPIEEAEKSSLEWTANKLQESIADRSKARYRAANEKLLAGIRKELATR